MEVTIGLFKRKKTRDFNEFLTEGKVLFEEYLDLYGGDKYNLGEEYNAKVCKYLTEVYKSDIDIYSTVDNKIDIIVNGKSILGRQIPSGFTEAQEILIRDIMCSLRKYLDTTNYVERRRLGGIFKSAIIGTLVGTAVQLIWVFVGTISYKFLLLYFFIILGVVTSLNILPYREVKRVMVKNKEAVEYSLSHKARMLRLYRTN